MDDFEAAWLAPVHKGVRIHFFGGSRDGEYVEIDSPGMYSIGRQENAALRFSDDDAVDCKASREHARINVRENGVTLERLSATNGLDVFNVEVEEGRVIALQDGDLIRVGRGGPRIGVRIGDLEKLQ